MSWIDDYIEEDIRKNPEMKQFYNQEEKNLDFIIEVCRTVDKYREGEYQDEYFIKDILDLSEGYLNKE